MAQFNDSEIERIPTINRTAVFSTDHTQPGELIACNSSQQTVTVVDSVPGPPLLVGYVTVGVLCCGVW